MRRHAGFVKRWRRAPGNAAISPTARRWSVLLIRNLIEGTTVTGVYAKPYADYNERTQTFLSVGSLIGGQVNLLGSRTLKGKKLDDILGSDDEILAGAGFP